MSTLFGDEEPEDALEEEQGEEGELAGRRLRFIPHDVPNVFRFEFGPAVLAQVLEKLEALPTIPLRDVDALNAPYPGFYQLFWRDGGEGLERSVYVGKTTRPLYQRLQEHRRKLQGRIPIDDMGVRFVFVEDLSLVGISEDTLIAYFGPLGLDDWGASGFGSKVTGAGRSGQTSAWSERFPPDLTFPVRAGDVLAVPLEQHLRTIQRGAPLTLSIPRRDRSRFRSEFNEAIEFEIETAPFEVWIARIEPLLEEKGWRIDRRPMAWYIRPL